MQETFHGGSIRILKAAMGRFAYDSDGILTLELAAHTILSTLLSKFIPAVLYLDVSEADGAEVRPTATEKKLIKLLSDSQISCYQRDAEGKDEGYQLYLRLLLVTDFISGMTDSYAKSLYQELTGIY